MIISHHKTKVNILRRKTQNSRAVFFQKDLSETLSFLQKNGNKILVFIPCVWYTDFNIVRFLTYYGAVIILADDAFWIVNITVTNEQADELNDKIFQWASGITLK